MGARRRGKKIRAFAAALLLATPALGQTTSNWTNAVSGNWTDSTKWSSHPFAPNNGSPPGTTYDAVLAATGAAHTVTLSNSITIDSLTIDSAAATVRQTSGTATLLDGLTINAGTFALAGGTLVTPAIGGAGTFTFDGNNAGTQFLRSAAGQTLTIAAGATIRTLAGSGTIDGTVVNQGTLIAEA